MNNTNAIKDIFKKIDGMEDFAKALDSPMIYVLEAQYGSDNATITIDWTHAYEQLQAQQAAARKKQVEKDRVLWEEPDVVVRHPYFEWEDRPMNDREARRYFRTYVPSPDTTKYEIEIVDKKLVKHLKKKYADRWFPCDGACGDPEHQEYHPVTLEGFTWDNTRFTKVVPAKKLSSAVKEGERVLAKILEDS